MRRFTRANRKGLYQRIIEPKVFGLRYGIVGIFSDDEMGWIVFIVQKSGESEDPVTVRAGGISAEGNGEKFE